ncbi:MAG TPA: 3-deoxy-manno-octulosonate cytidylyltransferase [Flavobacteriaceae bacterium]|jgi:3-deoxy-manno-octulosonate cytidylyltransferase (CMP-KDO synthetase)|nr:3-deoxy-manno-octulosonate cytidylyltransferase [Flavobacteriaceae bacterium]
MNILGVIPARYGSTRLEGKPLLDICGKPMIQHVYEQTKKALKHVVVATDDQRIVKAVQDFGGEVVLTSPDHNTGTNRCLEAYRVFTKKNNLKFDIIVNIQGDEPLLAPRQISLLTSCFNDKNTRMATLVIPVKETEKIFESGVFVVIDKLKNALYFSRSIIPFVRDADKKEWHKKHTFYKHIGMYAFKPRALMSFASLQQSPLEIAESLEQNRWLENGKKIKVEITKTQTMGVDTIEDLEKVREIICGKK